MEIFNVVIHVLGLILGVLNTVVSQDKMGWVCATLWCLSSFLYSIR